MSIYSPIIPFKINQAIVNAIARPDSPIKLVFATVALGMGCDLRHVKRVVLAGPPSCMEGLSYIQDFSSFLQRQFLQYYI